jgi:hypothetical protein
MMTLIEPLEFATPQHLTIKNIEGSSIFGLVIRDNIPSEFLNNNTDQS